ncbi:MAG: hypothetical protein ACKPCK_15490, partial [Dolichospermum sp.]
SHLHQIAIPTERFAIAFHFTYIKKAIALPSYLHQTAIAFHPPTSNSDRSLILPTSNSHRTSSYLYQIPQS